MLVNTTNRKKLPGDRGFNLTAPGQRRKSESKTRNEDDQRHENRNQAFENRKKENRKRKLETPDNRNGVLAWPTGSKPEKRRNEGMKEWRNEELENSSPRLEKLGIKLQEIKKLKKKWRTSHHSSLTMNLKRTPHRDSLPLNMMWIRHAKNLLHEVYVHAERFHKRANRPLQTAAAENRMANSQKNKESETNNLLRQINEFHAKGINRRTRWERVCYSRNVHGRTTEELHEQAKWKTIQVKDNPARMNSESNGQWNNIGKSAE